MNADQPPTCPRCGGEVTELQAVLSWACDACQRHARMGGATRRRSNFTTSRRNPRRGSTTN